MSISTADFLRATVRLVGIQEAIYQNVYFFKLASGGPVSDDAAVSAAEDWVTGMLSSLIPRFADAIHLGQCLLDVVERAGVYNPDPELNTAHLEVVRPVGFLAPSFNPTGTGEQYSGVDPGVVTISTNVARAYGRKSMSGWTEGQVGAGLLTNGALTDLGLFGIKWAFGPSYTGAPDDWLAGTVSMRLGVFAGFTGTMTLTNVTGTMVTRKIGRGI